MVAHCVNPNCGAQLHSFAEGRLFQFEVISISVSASEVGGPFDEQPNSQSAQFWLCGRCAATMSLVLEPINGLKIIPLASESADVNQLGAENGQRPDMNHC